MYMEKVHIFPMTDGLISYSALLEDVKYSIPEKVAPVIAAAYDKLDPKNTNSVPL